MVNPHKYIPAYGHWLVSCLRVCDASVAVIDFSCDIMQALEDVISLGCERVLTSGGKWTAPEGAPVIRRMIEAARGRIIVMPGRNSYNYAR